MPRMAPLYETVKSTLRDRIVAGMYRPGRKIPSEAELIREFEVSAITIRRALRDLTIEGRLIGRQGLGVFVADRPRITRSLNPDYNASLGDEIRRAGFIPGIKELSLTLIRPEPAIANAMKLRAGAIVYRHEKVILADGRPICFDVSFLQRRMGDVLRAELASEFLLPLLRKQGVRYHRMAYRIEAGSALEREATVLEVPVGTPLLGVWYQPVSADQGRTFLGHMLACAEWFSFEFQVPAAFSPNRTKIKVSEGAVRRTNGDERRSSR